MINEEKATNIYSQTCIKQPPTGNCKETLTQFPQNRSKIQEKIAILCHNWSLDLKFIQKLPEKCIDSVLIPVNKINKMVT